MNESISILSIFLLVNMTLITSTCHAQNRSDYPWEEVMENLSTSDEEGDTRNWENELEELTDLVNNPVNINSATKEQLQRFPFLNDVQIENLLAYIYIHGSMQTVYELQLVEELDRQTIQYLLPFVCVEPVDKKESVTLKQILKYGKHEAVTRMDVPLYKRKGYEKNYLGPAVYNSVKYGFHYREKVYAGIVAEKDSGEPFGALHNKQGYDYYSFYLLLHDIGILKTGIVGNYRLNFGQGLVLGQGSMFGKTAYSSSFTFRSTGIRRHTSTDEYNYFRGSGIALKWKQWTLSVFYSHRSLDGVIKGGEITSIYKTGLHRSEKEADKMNQLTMQMSGGNISYAGNSYQLGITGVYYCFNRSYEPELKDYSKYNLHGRSFYNLGMDYKYRFHRFSIQGEAALGISGMAFMNQVLYSPLQDIRLMLVHRYYSHDYWAMFAHSFSEGSSVQNENGWYLAASVNPFNRWTFFVSADLFSFPWWRYRISKASKGVDLLFQANYVPSKTVDMYVNYRYKQKERDVTGTQGKVILPTYHHRLRYRLNYLPCSSLSLRTTVDYNHFHSSGKTAGQGYQLTQTAGWKLPWLPLTAELQGSYFHTDDYDSRIYIYEKGLLYSFYTPSFQGEGIRLAIHFRYDMNKHWTAIAKFGQTTYFDRDEIGSGNDLIRGNKKTDVQMQLRLKF